MSDAIDAAIDELENALSDLRWAGRGANPAWYVSKARTAITRAEDHLNTIAPELTEADPFHQTARVG